MLNKLTLLNDEHANVTEEECQEFANMTNEEINEYWQAQHSYQQMKKYLEHPDTPEVIRNILNLSGWEEHQQ